MDADTLLRCGRCGREERVRYAHCLGHGWPRCCGRTMAVASSTADLDAAVDEVLAPAAQAIGLALSPPGQARYYVVARRGRGALHLYPDCRALGRARRRHQEILAAHFDIAADQTGCRWCRGRWRREAGG